jgi:pimeloyl-ACP methyl ester carboxylesterase
MVVGGFDNAARSNCVCRTWCATLVSVNVERVVYQGFGGVNLVADVRGDRDSLPVLFLHGGGQTRHAWDTSAAIVAEEGFQTLTIDLRGHGESDWAADGDYSFAAYVGDCVAVVARLQRPPVIVGASLGGLTAMLAEGRGDRILSCGLVLVDIAPKTDSKGVERIRLFMESGIDGFDSLEEAAAAIAAYTPHRKRRFNPAGLKKVLRQHDGRWYWHWDPNVMSLGRRDVVSHEFQELLNAAIDNITVPTMLVRGRLSDVVTQESVDDFVARMSTATVVEVEGAAHMIAGDQNGAFTQAVVTFLNESISPTIGP